MPFSIERNDLAHMDVDAIVVAANEELQITGGVGADVANAAGFAQVQRACDEIGFCPTGSAVATPGFGLQAETIVHVVGPVWQGGELGENEVLRAAYASALRCCADAGARSLAMPLISAGTYGFPSEVSFKIAMEEIRAFLDENDIDVRLVLFNRSAVKAAVTSFGEIAEYIDDHYVDARASERYERYFEEQAAYEGFRDGSMQQRRYEELDLWKAEGAQSEFDYEPMATPDSARAPMPIPESPDAPTPRSYGAPSAPARMPLETGAAPRRPAKTPGPLSRISEFIEELREGRREEKPSGEAKSSDEEKASVEASATMQMMPIVEPVQQEMAIGSAPGLGDWLDALDAPFSTTLLALIDERGVADVEVYKRANMSRQLFSKIRSDANYRPTKKTVLALAVALELDLDETSDLLRRAGFALSNSSKADVIVEYFIAHGKYDIFDINEALYAFDQPTL